MVASLPVKFGNKHILSIAAYNMLSHALIGATHNQTSDNFLLKWAKPFLRNLAQVADTWFISLRKLSASSRWVPSSAAVIITFVKIKKLPCSF